MRKHLLAVLVSVLAFAHASASGQNAGNSESEVKQAEDAWVKAVTAKDQKALEGLLAPRLVYTHSTGLIENKQEYMKAVGSFQNYKAITFENMRVNVYGTTAVVNTKARMIGSTRGTPFDNQLLLIHVWVKQGGKWQLAAHQTTRLTP
jgi:ketosteroid isomerase-like protein